MPVQPSATVSAPRTLLNISGGVDSTYALWHYAQLGRPLVLHHTRIRNHEGREALELRAVDRIIEWVDRRHPFPFWRVTMGYDYGTEEMRITKDKYVIGYQTGMLLAQKRHRTTVDAIVICSNKEDISRPGYYPRTELTRLSLIAASLQGAQQLHRFDPALAWSRGYDVDAYYPLYRLTQELLIEALCTDVTPTLFVGNRAVRIENPLKTMTKADLIERLPPELMRLTWWCRKPRAGKPCGRCITCVKVQPALAAAAAT